MVRHDDLDRTIRRLLDGQLYGVLCTQGHGQPYGSLVAFAMTPDLDSAVFATQKATRKYRLLSKCAHVALVVDNRSALPGGLMEVEAVTATGRAREMATGSWPFARRRPARTRSRCPLPGSTSPSSG